MLQTLTYKVNVAPDGVPPMVRLSQNENGRYRNRINSRDANRIAAMGILKEGQEVHHIKYHVDKHDDTWMNDILIMDREEHRKWHRDHPEFNALENIV